MPATSAPEKGNPGSAKTGDAATNKSGPSEAVPSPVGSEEANVASPTERRTGFDRYASLGPGDESAVQIPMALDESFKNLSNHNANLMSFLTQDFNEFSDEHGIDEYQVTFLDDSNPTRFIAPEWSSGGVEPGVYHFRDAPMARRVGGSLPKCVNAAEASILRMYGAFTLPSRQSIRVFVQSFWDRIQPIFPIIYDGSTSDHLFSLIHGNTKPQIVPLLLIQAILLSGATVFRNEKLTLPQEEILARLYGRAKALLHVGFEQDRVALVQVYLLFSTYTSDSFDDTLQNGWLSLGTAVRIAQGLGMHRDLGRAKASVRMRRQWKRIWWTLYLHDTMVSYEWGRPRAIHVSDFDVSPMTEADMLPTQPGALPNSEHMQVFLVLCNLSLILSEWMNLLRPGKRYLGVNADQNQFEKVGQKLHHWYASLPAILKEPATGQYTLWTATVHIEYHIACIRFSEKYRPDWVAVLQFADKVSSIFRSLEQQNLLESIWNYGIHSLVLVAAWYARELLDLDESVSLKGFTNLDEVQRWLAKLGGRSCFAMQFAIFYDTLLKKKGEAINLGIDLRTHMGLQEKVSSDFWDWLINESNNESETGGFDFPEDLLACFNQAQTFQTL